LVAIFVLLVSPNLEIGKETFDSLAKRDMMCGKFVALEIIFKVRRSKTFPVNHRLFYLACAMSCNVINPVLSPNKFMDSHCPSLHRPDYDDNSRILDLANMPAELTAARAPVDRGALNFLKLGCEKLAAWDFFAVLKTDQVGLAGGS